MINLIKVKQDFWKEKIDQYFIDFRSQLDIKQKIISQELEEKFIQKIKEIRIKHSIPNEIKDRSDEWMIKS